jgi:hypothetical protein
VPVPGFIDDATLLQYVSDSLARAQGPDGALQPFWTNIVTVANRRAYFWIQKEFLRRGFSAAQVDQWDYGVQYQQDLAMHLAVQRLAFLQEGFNAEALKTVDPREELKDMPLIVAGAIQDPAGTYGQVVMGEMDPTDAYFNGPWCEIDPRLGRSDTQW